MPTTSRSGKRTLCLCLPLNYTLASGWDGSSPLPLPKCMPLVPHEQRGSAWAAVTSRRCTPHALLARIPPPPPPCQFASGSGEWYVCMGTVGTMMSPWVRPFARCCSRTGYSITAEAGGQCQRPDLSAWAKLSTGRPRSSVTSSASEWHPTSGEPPNRRASKQFLSPLPAGPGRRPFHGTRWLLFAPGRPWKG